MVKLVIKSEKLTPFGGIFSIMELFNLSVLFFCPHFRHFHLSDSEFAANYKFMVF